MQDIMYFIEGINMALTENKMRHKKIKLLNISENVVNMQKFLKKKIKFMLRMCINFWFECK